MTDNDDILHMFKNINNKLKKKFMRSVNLEETSEEFNALANYCEKIELPQYCGLCLGAVVNCEEKRKNYVDAIITSVKAGNKFVDVHKYIGSFGCYPVSDEFLQAALNCYTRAASLSKYHPLENLLNSKISVSTACILDTNERNEESACWLQKALLCVQHDSPDRKIQLLENLITQMIKASNFLGALHTCMEMIDVMNKYFFPLFGIYEDMASKYEVTIILLLLILKPNPRKLTVKFSNILERYTWMKDADNLLQSPLLSNKLFYLVQSLVMNCQVNNIKNIYAVEKEILPYLVDDQISLLTTLINSLQP